MFRQKTDKRVAVFFAEGFEEVEAISVVDILFRAGIPCDMVSITGELNVTSSTRTASIAIARSSTPPLTVHCTTMLRITRSGSSPSRTSWTPSTTTSRPRFTISTSRS